MLRDDTHLFRLMWAAEPLMQREQPHADGRPVRPSCWDVSRDQRGAHRSSAEAYFQGVLQGSSCGTNWYEGNPGELGQRYKPPFFESNAPALLGFDESIDGYCAAQPTARSRRYGSGHAANCVHANLNILSLYGQRVPYNLCRNLEWQVCAAKNLLPGQRGGEETSIVFSRAPSSLDVTAASSKPLGQCRGWRPMGTTWDCASTGYATDDIFFLEVCIFSQICKNGAELFLLQPGEPFKCKFKGALLHELKEILLTPPREKTQTAMETAENCESWCNRWTCAKTECAGCATDCE